MGLKKGPQNSSLHKWEDYLTIPYKENMNCHPCAQQDARVILSPAYAGIAKW